MSEQQGDAAVLDRVGQLCPDDTCTGTIDSEGQCDECGALVDLRPTEPATEAAEPTDSGAQPESAATSEDPEVEFARRRLCPDGSCIGVIGSNGRCRECGLVDHEVMEDPRLRGLKGSRDEEAQQLLDEELVRRAEARKDGGDVDGPAELPSDFEARQLCPDGGCIGIIGEDGCCKECGSVA